MLQKISWRRKNLQKAVFFSFSSSAFLNGILLIIIVFFLLSNGIEAISWEFLSQPPTDSMTKGGIFPCIVGTFLLCAVTIITALPIGVASAIYLNEYAIKGKLIRIIRMGIFANLDNPVDCLYNLLSDD